jgi:alkaline phosphatase D
MATSLPSGVKPEDAAAIGIAGLTETQSIRPNVKPGDKVFINGGSGGTGVYGIQIAKALGCHVTTTCSTPNVAFCKSLGADEVIDYKTSDVVSTLSAQTSLFALVVDNIGTPADLYQKSGSFIAPGGKFVQIGAAPDLSGMAQVSKNMLLPCFLGGGKAKYQMLMGQASKSDLQLLAGWMVEGKVKGVLDSVFEWEDAPKAYEKLKTGRARGKIVVRVAQDE